MFQDTIYETVHLSVLWSGTPNWPHSICPRERSVAKFRGWILLTLLLACRTHGNRISTTCSACGASYSIPRSPQSIGGGMVDSATTDYTNGGVGEGTLTDQIGDQSRPKFLKYRSRRPVEPTRFPDRDGHILICGNNTVRSVTNGDFTSILL